MNNLLSGIYRALQGPSSAVSANWYYRIPGIAPAANGGSTGKATELHEGDLTTYIWHICS